ncbi:hypothetical protein [Gimibacter soli]|uniref:Uncharacterized protein n=1 Tax=Gimibacter soli TaxID=3024400 RepID=A0AAF0BIP8_9PROT|nr:hypothetical protein [Gimibacter soli]WCL55663.1 hypothetical protein PH603_07830 [Gimibacter soli]
MTNPQPDMKDDALRPRAGFLVCAAVAAGGAVATYLNEDVIIDKSGDMAFVVLLAIFVLISLMFVLFFRVPSIGNRLLGQSAVLDAGQREKKGAMSTFTSPFNVETGVHEKRQATARKSARATRKSVAATTRAMHAERKAKGQDKEGDA